MTGRRPRRGRSGAAAWSRSKLEVSDDHRRAMAAEDHPVPGEAAMENAGAVAGLKGAEFVPTESLCPIRRQRTVSRARHWVLIDPGIGHEDAAGDVLHLPGGGDDGHVLHRPEL